MVLSNGLTIVKGSLVGKSKAAKPMHVKSKDVLVFRSTICGSTISRV